MNVEFAGSNLTVMYLGIIVAIVGVIVAFMYSSWVLKQSSGNKQMQEISKAVQEGAMAYLSRQYKSIAIIGIIVAIIIALAIDITTAVGFVVGAVLSAFCGYVGMFVSSRGNAKVAEAARKSLPYALTVAFRGGAVTGLMCVGLALLGVSVLFLSTGNLDALIGLGFGASLISVFARLGGGIYTKSADVGADLVGKVESDLPEDDPRNPGTIADNVGDNVGDCAGMAADLFETYVVTAIGAMLLGGLAFKGADGGYIVPYIVYPVLLGAVAIIATILGTFFVKLKEGSDAVMNALYKGMWGSAILALIGFYFVTNWLLDTTIFFLPAVIGVVVTVLIVYITDYYTSTNFRPVRSISYASQSGHATNIITGISVGMEGAVIPGFLIVGAILGSYSIGAGGFPSGEISMEGLYSISIASMAMLSMTGIVVALDAYGPITDNGGGIAEMAELPEDVREKTDALDAVGNTTKAVTKGYAIGSAGLAALVLLADYMHKLAEEGGKELVFLLGDPLVIAGLLIGAALPFLFSALAMGAVGRAAYEVVDEVRRQLREKPGIMTFKEKPDYGRCVDIVTKRALKEMIAPGIIPVAAPLIVGFLIGPVALGGMLFGVIVSGLYLAIFQTSGGGAWDNAKKYIEEGNYGGKKSEAHAAAVTGDTVGDPLKDTAGPAINPMIKVVNIVALLIVGLIV